jgi:hypothetical protein
MNNFLNQVIEETFKSTSQQKYFYSKANDKSLSFKERKKWSKMAKEFSSKTNFKNLPKTVTKDVDEIVDENGDIMTGNKPTDAATKGITSKSTTDQVVGNAMGMMGAFGVGGVNNTSRTIRYWGESDMSKTLGFKDTLGVDADYDQAKSHFEDELGLDDAEAEERLEKMGYDEELPGDKVRLVENPRRFIEEYLDNILKKKAKANDLVKKSDVKKPINPIITRQINSFKQTLKDNNLTVGDITEYLEDNE